MSRKLIKIDRFEEDEILRKLFGLCRKAGPSYKLAKVCRCREGTLASSLNRRTMPLERLIRLARTIGMDLDKIILVIKATFTHNTPVWGNETDLLPFVKDLHQKIRSGVLKKLTPWDLIVLLFQYVA